MTLLGALEISLLAVCIWGFIAVLLTAQFSAIIILACMGALIAGYWFRRNGWRPSLMTANLVAIAVLLIAGTILVYTQNLLIASVYLFLLLQVTKYVTRRSLAEGRWCYVISLFNIIGASVITTTVAFGIMLIGYILLTLVSLRFFVICREWERSLKDSAPQSNSPVTAINALRQQRVPRGMYGTGLIWTAIILLMAGGLFSAVPRLATQNLFQSYGPPQDDPAVSAFSENVEFGSFTEIQQDNAIALFVQPVENGQPTNKRPDNVRMRGVALDTFDGKSWKRTGYTSPQNSTYEFRPIFTTRMYPTTYNYRIIQPPGVTNFLFGDSFPLMIRLPTAFPFYVDRMAQSAYLAATPPKELQYEVESMHEDLSKRTDPILLKAGDRPAAQLTLDRARQADKKLSDDSKVITEEALNAIIQGLTSGLGNNEDDETSSNQWALFGNDVVTSDGPETTAAIADLDDTTSAPGNEITRRRRNQSWGNRYGYMPRMTGQEILHDYLTKCLALPENLSTGRVPQLAQDWTENAPTTFTKAIAVERRLRNDFAYSLTPRARGNYIDSFLFDVQEGHCEYFATSMAVLLRNIGIPARVVNGFYSSEWNSYSGNFTARQKDAHSWVEAWLGDKYGWMTFDPTPPGGVTRRSDRGAFLEGLSRLSDAAKMRWYRYVVDYSISDQTAVVRRLLTWRQNIMQSLNHMKIMGISGGASTEIQFGDFSGEVDLRITALGTAAFILFTIWLMVRWIRRRRRARYSRVRYYDDLLRLLSRRGISIAAGQTPREFARQVRASNMQWGDFVYVTELYYASRFQNSRLVLKSEDVDLIANLKAALKQRRH